MENEIPWGKIQYYLIHSDEKPDEELQQWLQKSDYNRKLWGEVKLTYLISGELPREFEPDQKVAWSKIENRIAAKQRRVRLNPVFLKVAASILLFFVGGLAGYYLMQHQEVQYAEVFSPYGHKTKVVLPDQSVVWLNGNSSLKYATNFEHSRDVQLTGEALLQVTKDPGNVFRLRSGDVKVEVYGTKFNFKHYSNDQNAEVALIEGSVGLFNRDKLLTKMTPGQVANLNPETNKLEVSSENMDMIVSWSTDELVVENQSFGEVLKYLERWYGVEFHYDKSIDLQQRLSFKVKTESLPELLSTIGYLTSIKYRIEGKNVELSK
ncbi:FecR family protein [Mangrovibacterium diazotrophicum]|uniref:FecR family protein n=1 Tax=Mangrovibacterium diazotrophicum TaxID=1261403 RepID=A0A419VWK6_9BACT|nr:FecR family protein [Mangrovibacterium diazotrophicum]RKD86456.1 FecR family protein [Mangrovibacterium diazotrophicum]